MEQVEGKAEGTADARLISGGLHVALWHRHLQLVLAAHVPLLLVLALLRDVEPLLAVVVLVAPAALAVAAGSVGGARVRAAMVAIGLVWSSWLLVVWSGGVVEAQLHGLVVIGLVGLYRDRIALALVTAGLALLHLGPGLLRPELVHDHPAAVADPLAWTLTSLVAVAAAGGLVLLTWRGAAVAESALRDSDASRQREADERRHQEELAAIYATVARRSQGLRERQLQVVEQMEAEESDPATLQQLFLLDHLTTRMNREAASMLVLAGGEPNRRVTGTPPLSEVVRGAVGETEDYTRVELLLGDDRAVEGRLVAALVHILSELVENAATYSPPTETVRVEGATSADGGYRLHIIDRGIGLDDARLEEYNHLLATPPGTAPRANQRLGLDVIARLAGRHALPIRLSHNTDGPGVTATVHVPAHLLSVAPPEVLADALDAEPMPAPQAPAAAITPVDDTAPPAAVPAATASPVASRSGGPRWASATSRAGSRGGPPAAAPTPQPATPVAPPVARPTAPPRPAAIHSTVRSATSWSYSGHLERRPEPSPADTDEGSRARRFGRGSRSQVGGVAPRPSPQPGAPGEWPDAAGPSGREPPARPTVGGRTTVGGRASQPEQRPQRDHPQAAPPATGPSPLRPGADDGPSAAPNRRAAGGGQGDRAGAASAAGDQVDTPKRGRPTAMELLAGIGGTPAAADEQQPLHEPDIGAPVGLGRGPFQGHPAADLQAAQGASSSSPADPAPPEPADSGPPLDRGGPADAESRPAAAAASAAWGPAIGHAHGPDADDLPQRRRGESLPSGLRGEVDEQPQRSASAAPVSREESRSLLSSYQSRLQAGRKAAEDQVARSRKPTPATPESTPAEGDPTPSWGEAGPDEAP